MSARPKWFLGFFLLGLLLAASGCSDPAATTGALCGDGVVRAPEACDDGNLAPHDGCSASCEREPADCAGTYAGTAAIDACGVCAGGTTGQAPCTDTCRQAHGDGAYVDHCGTCVGGDTGLEACAQDCAGEWGGSAAFDNCGTCAGGQTGVDPCALDCAGVYGGAATVDHCGQCTGGTTGATACVQDCSGTWGGSAAFDHCGTCAGGTTGATACVRDCHGDWGGAAFLDECGACVGGATGAAACTEDCHGDWGGTAVVDHCGVCVGGATGATACVADCHGDFGGTAAVDQCGVCAGGSTGHEACRQDCNGQWGGQASIDGCGRCVGGSTGQVACANDCHGDLGGTAHLDECGVCVGGATGATACVRDCSGAWGGSASVDTCNRCTGGTTGRDACSAGTCVVGHGETIASLVANPACLVVQIPAGSYTVSLDLTAATMGGKPSVELRGAGSGATSLVPIPYQHVVTVRAGRALVLRDLKVTGSIGGGGPVWNEGTLELHGVEVSGNRSETQGAGVVNLGTATIDHSLIADNRVTAVVAAYGAGVANAGQLEIVDSTITRNRVAGRGNFGAGLYNQEGEVRLTRVSIDANTSFYDTVLLGGKDRGAGIYSEGGAILGEAVRVTNNTIVTTNSRAEGGGIAIVEGRLELSPDSIVDGNGATGSYAGSGGGLFAEHPTALRVAGVSFSGNTASGQQGAEGGAITVLRGSLVLAGNALDRNTVTTNGFQGSGAAAVLIREGRLDASGVTMNGNRVDGGSVRGGLVRVEDMTSPSEADEALVLADVTANGNRVATTHGIVGGLFYANDVLLVHRATLHDNVVDGNPNGSFGGSGVEGGLIASRRLQPGQTVLEGVDARGNHIVVGGNGSEGGLVRVDVFHGETDVGAVELRGCHLVDNVVEMRTPTWLQGGLVAVDGAQSVTVERCDIRDNAIATEAVPAPGPGGNGVGVSGGIFEISVPSAATGETDAARAFRLVASGVSGNRIGNLTTSARVDGGVLLLYLSFAYGTRFTLGAVSSTFFGNVVGATQDSSLFYVTNRFAPDAAIELANVTMARNRVKGRLGVVLEVPGEAANNVTLHMANTILLGDEPTVGGECLLSGAAAHLVSDGYNLLDAGGACSALSAQPSDALATSSALGDLGDHGGGSYTVAIDATPALDGGDPAGCRFEGVAVTTDQRGLPRPAGARCDIGAFERQ